MEIQIKKTVKAGNSSAVILPKSWLDEEVRVELIKKTSETILLEIINIAGRYIDLKSIIGIYLTGSYARGEEDENSDIDVLIITKNIDKEMINEGIYNLLIVSSELLNQKLNQDLLPIGQMIKEAKPIINSDYLDSIDVKVTKKNINWYLKTTEDKLKMIKEVLDRIKDKNKKYISDVVGYTLILRIRTLYIISKLMRNEDYSKKDFEEIIKKISKGRNAYERYLAVKNNSESIKRDNSEEKNGISIEEAERLYKYLKNQLVRAKKSVKNKKIT